MEVSGDADGKPVPDVLFEAYFKSASGAGNVVHVRVSGSYWEFDELLRKFKQLCELHKYSTGGPIL